MLLVYVVKSLLKRFSANLVTILSIALFVAGCTVGIAFYLGLKRQVVDATPPENILVLSRGAASEGGSRLNLETARKVALLPGLAVEGTPLAARELLSSVGVSSEGSTKRGSVPIRGIDESSIRVHGVTVTGAPPAPGSLDVIVGERLLEQYPNLRVGSTLTLLGGKAPITGTFRGSPGDPINGELWTQRSALELHIKAKQSSSMMLVADTEARVAEIVAKISSSKDLEADAYSLRAYRASEAGLAKIVKIVLLMVILLSLVAGLAIMTTMTAAVSSRMTELAVLLTIGFQRGRLGRLIVMESILLAAVGSLLGLAASFLVAKLLASLDIRVDLMTTPVALALGLGLGLAVGLLGGLLPANKVRRLEIIKYVR